MNINGHIERLILGGVPVTSDQTDSVHAAVKTELARLLANKGLDCSFGYAVPHLTSSSIQLSRVSKPSLLGHQIAQAIYGGLSPAAELRHGSYSFGGAST